MWTYRGVNVHWLGHDSFVLSGTKTVVIDPFKAQGNFKADLLLVSHEHFDHLSVDDLKKVVTPATTVITITTCEKAVKDLKPKAVRVVLAGDRLTVDGVSLEVLPAYNTNKFRSPGNPFHPKADGKVGFILEIGGVRIYHAGDTDEIPEMTSAKGVDVALLPVSGTYVMTAQEAVKACTAIQPKLAIPMHYGAIVGSPADAEVFRKAVKCRVEILAAEP